jgi:hypothetical protein
MQPEVVGFIMAISDDAIFTRRRLLGILAVAVAGSAAVVATTGEAEAKRGGRGGQPYGWSRGRKRGWAKKGGPKWRW